MRQVFAPANHSFRAWAQRRCSPLAFAGLVVLLSAVTFVASDFRSASDVLADGTWGAGTPSASAMAAIALGRPWWRPTKPEPVTVREDGAIEPVVRIPRSAIVTRWCREALPTRGVGYDVFGGVVVAIRSMFSDDLVFDFALLIRIQNLLLVVSLAAALSFLWRSRACFQTNKTTGFIWLTYVGLMFLRPNRSEYLNQGIIDSALANPLAILAVPALAATAAAIGGRCRWGFAAGPLFFGLAMLVRADPRIGSR